MDAELKTGLQMLALVIFTVLGFSFLLKLASPSLERCDPKDPDWMLTNRTIASFKGCQVPDLSNTLGPYDREVLACENFCSPKRYYFSYSAFGANTCTCGE